MPEQKKIERRCSAANFEVRAEGDEGSRHVVGYASVFDSPSVDMGFREVISKGAFDGVVMASDVLAVLNHNVERGVLARSNKGSGSLKLDVDDAGLRYEFDAPNTALGDELLEGLRRGDISASSFAFTVAEERWEHQADDSYVRYIDKVERLYDVSPVYHPAYEATSCDLRGLEAAKAEAAKQLDEAKAKEAGEQRNKEMEKYKKF